MHRCWSSKYVIEKTTGFFKLIFNLEANQSHIHIIRIELLIWVPTLVRRIVRSSFDAYARIIALTLLPSYRYIECNLENRYIEHGLDQVD